ncbi:hypothetical protein PENTCL1PPCAC_3529, partial [Pristionchus entomophagus]
LSAISINARSVSNKLDMLGQFLCAHALSLVFISETWATRDTVTDNMMSFDRYSVYRSDRDSSTRGGGCAILVDRSIPSFLIDSRSFSIYCQIVVCSVRIMRSSPTVLVCVYRSPSCSIDLTADSHHSKAHLDFSISSSLSQLISDPTRNDRILDLVLVSDTRLVSQITVEAPLPSLDHNLVIFGLIGSLPSSTDPPRRDFGRANWEAINSHIASIDWPFVLSQSNDPDHLYETFCDILRDLIEAFVPITKPSTKRAKLSPKTRKLIQKCRLLYRRHRIKDECPSLPTLIVNSHHHTSASSKASVLADTFRSSFSFSSPPTPSHPIPLCDQSIDYVDIDLITLCKILRSLPSRNSTTPDFLPWIESFLKNRTQSVMVDNSFSTPYPDFDFKIGQISLPTKTVFKDLGIAYDNKLSFSSHIQSIVSRAKARCAYITRTFSSRSLKLYARLFSSYVRPILEYGSELWSPTDRENIKLIESVQRKFSERVFNKCREPLTNYTNRLRALGLTTLESRRANIDL